MDESNMSINSSLSNRNRTVGIGSHKPEPNEYYDEDDIGIQLNVSGYGGMVLATIVVIAAAIVLSAPLLLLVR